MGTDQSRNWLSLRCENLRTRACPIRWNREAHSDVICLVELSAASHFTHLTKRSSQFNGVRCHPNCAAAIVLNLRDGMNLVAKEYVASQNPHDPGVLILSRFAGAAHECKAALLVNPYDPDSVAVAIGQALSMPLAERRERHDSLFRVLSQNDIQHWADRFLSTLEREPSVLSRLEQMPSEEMQ
jgi:trehalose-6-phosphate synthase